jgi:S1-C subfamily serine protease
MRFLFIVASGGVLCASALGADFVYPGGNPANEAISGAETDFVRAEQATRTNDYAAAARLLRVSSEKGHLPSLLRLGSLYCQGLGVPKDPIYGLDCIYSAAARGYPPAQLELAMLYASGNGATKDETKARLWAQRAAESEGTAEAWTLLALLTTPVDAKLAAAYSERARQAAEATGKTNDRAEFRSWLEPAQAGPPPPPPNGRPGAPPLLSGEELYRLCAPACVLITVREKDGAASGSGFFVSADGYLLTNEHVVRDRIQDDTYAVKVTTLDGKAHYARLIEATPSLDLAVLKVDAVQPVSFLKRANSEKVRQGTEVFAIGNPGTPAGLLTWSIAEGIVSGLRDSESPGARPSFQITVPTNKGNSGGPLLDRHGRVIGVCYAGYGPLQTKDGSLIGSDKQLLNFAVRLSFAEAMLTKLGVERAHDE